MSEKKTPHATLVDAKALIADPKAWAKGYWAYNVTSDKLTYASDGDKWSVGEGDWDYAVGSYKDDAKCWCALGALGRVGLNGSAVRLLEAEMNDNIATFNDHKDTTHEMVLAAFDRAIAKALEIELREQAA